MATVADRLHALLVPGLTHDDEEFWRKQAADAPRLWKIGAFVGVVAMLFGFSADMQNIPEHQQQAAILIRLLGVLWFVLAGALAFWRPELLQRHWKIVHAAPLYVVPLVCMPLSLWGDGLQNLYYMAVLEAEIAVATFFPLPYASFWVGMAAGNILYLAPHFGATVAENPILFGNVLTTLAIFMVLAGGAHHLQLSYRIRSWKSMEELQHATTQIAEILDSISEAFFHLDREWRFVYFNEAAELLLRRMHHSSESLLGVNIWDAFPNLVADSLMHDEFHRAVREGEMVRFDEFYPLMQVHLEIHAYPTEDGISAYCTDVTTRKQAEDALQTSHDQLEERVIERTAALRRLLAHLDSIRESERQRISSEIHDDLGQTLTVAQMDIAWLRERVPDGSQLGDRLDTLSHLIEQTMQGIRRIAYDLRPAGIDEFGLQAAVEWLSGQIQRSGQVVVNVHFDDSLPEFQNGDRTIVAFRIVQEAVNNAIRHGHCDQVDIEFLRTGNHVTIRIADNGCGIAEDIADDPDRTGIGLLSMQERATQLGGSITISNRSEGGVEVVVQIPITSLEIAA